MIDLDDHDREFTQRKGPYAPRTTRPDRLFQLVVKRACKKCNSGWMNDLDCSVEEWVVDPDDEARTYDPTQFRRWAIKVAIMRTFVDSPVGLPPEDFQRLLEGDDLAEWHVFVGRSHVAEWRHNYAAFAGGQKDLGYISAGLIHVSWVVGTSVVSTFRLAGGAGVYLLLNGFRQYNLLHGSPLVEIPHCPREFPKLSSRPKLIAGQAEPLFRFFTDERSPVAGIMRDGYRKLYEAAVEKQGD
ncbi:hypothetical protein [Mycobacterium marseillense]|uniref:hypothetical protein n=1 Tax=Mycobacterium marseillense TaxID=701042 RepID=UPI00104251E8|nr:hypothetical protein [Mycobacterium marseillense]MCA2261987.1 hypothetical protein [Mycobacterium marseillense]